MDADSRLLLDAFQAALAAAAPARWLPRALAGLPRTGGRWRVLSLGKAAIPMAQAFAGCFEEPWTGLAVTPAGAGRAIEGFTVLEAAHPVPDERSLTAGEAVLAFAAQAAADETLLVLVSGGTSALVCAPIAGVSLPRKSAATRALLAAGIGIDEINVVRRALSRVKGGGVLRATGAARVFTIALSDVPSDSLADIGSGLSVEVDPQPEEAIAILEREAPQLAAELAGPIRAHARAVPPVRAQGRGQVGFGVSGGAEAAVSFLESMGRTVMRLGVATGDAVITAGIHGRQVESRLARAYVSCGELMVKVPDGAAGRGGRNQHYLLALASALAGQKRVWALAADTDGIDGGSPAAGARIDPTLLATLDLADVEASLANFDAHGFFARHGRLVETGPTGVNVGDLRIILVEP
jgi:hydroxypyruvate reductase